MSREFEDLRDGDGVADEWHVDNAGPRPGDDQFRELTQSVLGPLLHFHVVP